MASHGLDIQKMEQEQVSDAERFALAAIQTVSAATAFGILNQFRTLLEVAGPLAVLIALTLDVAALAVSIVAAYLRHEYRKWEIEARLRQPGRYIQYLLWMRRLMLAAAVLIVVALGTFLVAMWWKYFVSGFNLPLPK